MHRMAERARRKGLLTMKGRAVAERAAVNYDVGDIAVIDDSGGVIARQNPFNLGGRMLSFLPSGEDGKRYRFDLAPAAFNDDASAQGKALEGLGDDDARAVDLPFEFPFFGAGYRVMYVHSDGNVTFEQPETASTSRSLGRLTSGPPRIAPQFSDLDPTQQDGDVRVWSDSASVVVTWRNVPIYSDYGVGSRQTFQLAMFPDGRIVFNYALEDTGDIVVGISPGHLTGSTEVVSFLDGSQEDYASTVAERFGASDGVDMIRAAQRFYETHEDSYDYLVFFNTAGVEAAPSALAYETTVRSFRRGIGDTPVDNGASYGSPRRLQSALNMGPLSQYPLDPYARVGSRGAITGDNTMTLIGHETGHLFLALASIRDPDDPRLRPMLGVQNAHWSFNFNSEASLLEGNRIQDNGTNATNRFVTTGTVEGYSPLDQYLMGMRDPGEVPPTFLVRHSNISATSFPRTGVVIRGDRYDVTVQDLIAAEGHRIPDATVEQRRFRFAFVLITPAGTDPTSAQLAQLETYRAEFERYFTVATQDRGAAYCTLQKSANLSLWPAGGVVAGQSATGRIEIAEPLNHDMTFGIWVTHGHAEAPLTVTIPKGQTSTEFPVKGITSGVSDLVTEGWSGNYEPVFARIPVVAAAADLTLTEYYRGEGHLWLRVKDQNNVPYSNLSVAVQGMDKPLTTDLRGLVWMNWDFQSDVTAEIAGAPSTRLVVKAVREQ